MKKSILLLLSIVLLSSCSSVNVVTDYDSKTDFNKYKTFAFYKPNIDKAKVSDLDKKRILRAIEAELLASGFTKSNKPDILVGIFTKSREKVIVSRGNMGNDWGWNPQWGSMNNDIKVNQKTEGTLFIDFIDATTKELIWQGIGTGALNMRKSLWKGVGTGPLKHQYNVKKEERINLFVKEIISRFPPGQEK